jgi:hypothetical protein
MRVIKYQDLIYTSTSTGGRAMAKAVNRWPLTVEARVRTILAHVEFVVDKVAVGRSFYEFFGFPSASHHSTIALYQYVTDP